MDKEEIKRELSIIDHLFHSSFHPSISTIKIIRAAMERELKVAKLLKEKSDSEELKKIIETLEKAVKKEPVKEYRRHATIEIDGTEFNILDLLDQFYEKLKKITENT